MNTSVESKVGADPEAMLVEAVCDIVMTKLESSELQLALYSMYVQELSLYTLKNSNSKSFFYFEFIPI